MQPQDLLYSASDEWIALEGDVATVGITDLAVEALTDLVFIELPKPGRQLQAGQVFGVVESVKAASDLYSPVSGEVVAVNDRLGDDLANLSSDPFGKGWLMKVRLSGPLAASLLDRKAYEAHWKTRH
ncbi:MAG TPA: glycine cleavage system protein GcvH [Planctomycetaceae bacterium]|jgi:glycine cleavage system H protein|nr:glycine cleavage system protein GcvH [Planctomycetaceae bacterium]